MCHFHWVCKCIIPANLFDDYIIIVLNSDAFLLNIDWNANWLKCKLIVCTSITSRSISTCICSIVQSDLHFMNAFRQNCVIMYYFPIHGTWTMNVWLPKLVFKRRALLGHFMNTKIIYSTMHMNFQSFKFH